MGARPKVINANRMQRRALEEGRREFPENVAHRRPKTRADCMYAERPCPFVSCQYHLYLDVMPRNGSIKLNFPDVEVEDMAESCALDVADRGGSTLEAVAALMNMTRERVRQIEEKAKPELRRLPIMQELGDGMRSTRHTPIPEVDSGDVTDSADAMTRPLDSADVVTMDSADSADV